MSFPCTDCDYGIKNILVKFMLTEMEHNSKTDVSNIFDKYYPALYKDFGFIEENMKILTINRTKLLFIMLTTQIQKCSICF